MKLECNKCWENNNMGYDVETEHTIKGNIATCTVCGTKQDIEELSDNS